MPFEIHFQRLWVGGFAECLLLADFAGFDKLEKSLIKIDHAVVVAGLDGGGQFVETIFPQSVFLTVAVLIKISTAGRDTTGDGPSHSLADYRLKSARELPAYLFPVLQL